MNQPLELASRAICSEFEIEVAGEGLMAQTCSLETLREMLSKRIRAMLYHDFEQLMAALYRIDVDEPKAQVALRERDAVRASDRLAELIIERQVEKAESRIRRRGEIY